MAFSTIPVVLLSLLALFSEVCAQNAEPLAKSQKESFYSITRNKSWTVNQYLLTAKQTDKKATFTNSTFSFDQVDTSTFSIETKGTNTMKGYWKAQDGNNVILSLPLIIRDSSTLWTTTISSPANASTIYERPVPKNSLSDSIYNEVASMLSGGSMQIIDINPTKLKLKLRDASRGVVFIELIRKD